MSTYSSINGGSVGNVPSTVFSKMLNVPLQIFSMISNPYVFFAILIIVAICVVAWGLGKMTGHANDKLHDYY